MSRFKRMAPYLLLGPVTGPLAFGLVASLRDRHPILAALYALAILEFWLVTPLLVARLGLQLV